MYFIIGLLLGFPLFANGDMLEANLRKGFGEVPPKQIWKINDEPVAYYDSIQNGVRKTAYVSRHEVRSLSETVVVWIEGGVIERIEVVSFDEPKEYAPSKSWLSQFEGKTSQGAPSLKREIQGITGSSITSRVLTRAVEQILNIDKARWVGTK